MIRIIEGVTYHRYVVTFAVKVGGAWKRRRLIHWSPGYPWIREEVARSLDDLYGLENIKPGSVEISARADSTSAPTRG